MLNLSQAQLHLQEMQVLPPQNQPAPQTAAENRVRHVYL